MKDKILIPVVIFFAIIQLQYQPLTNLPGFKP
jgi:hypothetical protein